MFTANQLREDYMRDWTVLDLPESWRDALKFIMIDASVRPLTGTHEENQVKAWLVHVEDGIATCVKKHANCELAANRLLTYVRHLYTSPHSHLFADAHDTSAATRRARTNAVEAVLAELPAEVFMQTFKRIANIPSDEAHSLGELNLRQQQVYGRRFAGGARRGQGW